MGGERTWNGKRLFIYIAGAVVTCFVFSSCTGISISVMEDFNFRKADLLMKNGQYAAALAENKRVLAQGPASLNDKALYRIALIYTHDENNLRNLYNAREYFFKIIDEYPESSLRTKSKMWVRLIDKIDSTQKEITDLSTDNNILKNNIANLGIDNASLNAVNINLKNERELLKKDIEKSEKRINLLKEKVTELEYQIDNLKKIDLDLEQIKSKEEP